MKRLYLILIIVLGISSLFAQTAIPPAVGDGTEENPYQIETLENLYWITADNDIVPNPDREARWSSHYIQTADIDASDTENWFGGEGWSPIGWLQHTYFLPFTGSYDGQDHTIGGLFINRPDSGYIGLFGYADGAIIENLGVTNVNITGYDGTGGLVAWQSYSTISNSYSTGSVSGYACVGGLVGSKTNSIISNSHSTVNVTGDEYVGGLVGNQSGISTINNNYSNGSVNGIVYVGGLVGFQSGNCNIDNSYSTGNVTGLNAVGGLVGRQLGSTINNSYSTGSVNGDNSVGGLVGIQYFNSAINNSYSTGSVTGDADVGGLVGRQSYSIINNSYWNIETSGQTTSVGGEGRTTEEMTYPYADNTYVDWDFEEIWAADVNHTINNGYPYLQDTPHVSAEDEVIAVITLPTLSNYPNPFNPETTISFSLQQEVESWN